jgi:cytochrome P450
VLQIALIVEQQPSSGVTMIATDILTISSISNDDLEHDPYPIYAELRRKAPVAHLSQLDINVVTRWNDCHQVGSMEELTGGSVRDDAFFGAPNILHIDGPEHEAMRAGIDVELKPRRVNKYVDHLTRELTRDYIDRIVENRSADLVSELLDKVSVRAVGTVLGLGDLDDETLITWFRTLSAGNTDAFDADEETKRKSQAVREEIDTYLRNKAAFLRDHPDHTMLSHMIHVATPDGTPRSYEEIRPSTEVIILGGFQEPSATVSNAVLGILQDPEQRELMVSDPRRYAALAVEESLRWIAPIGLFTRSPQMDVVVGEVTVPAGTELNLLVGSANRDEKQFNNPDKFDLQRVSTGHMAFGYGRHHCAGHSLARGISRICLEEVFERLPGLALDSDDSPVVEGWAFRGTTKLPVVWN